MVDKQVIVVGAGASGMMAAGRAAESGAEVLLLEKTGNPGNKILLSGQTRCNLTNIQEMDTFISMYGANGRFLHNVFHHFFRDELLIFLQRYSVKTITEKDGRIFPASGDAHDVVKAMQNFMADNGVKLQTETQVTNILIDKGCVAGVQSGLKTFPAAAVILATGGASYPATGSTGDGYRIAAKVKHTIIPIRPALVPLVVTEKKRARSMQGVSLRNVRLTAYQCPASDIKSAAAPTRDFGRGIIARHLHHPVIESRTGDVMITHFGLSGPVILQMSLAIVDALKNGPVSVGIDLEPMLDSAKLKERLQKDFSKYGKKSYRNLLKVLIPPKLVESFMEMTGVSPDKLCNQVDAVERDRLLGLLKSLSFNIRTPLPLALAMVTAGGISIKEINPQNMASRIVAGLYFCGEVMDIDADTGGYNLQAAFSTGYAAGESAAAYINNLPR